MADVQPLRALHFDPAVAGDFGDLVAPPYDVIDVEHRARLASRAPYNVVNIDLPEADGDIYEHAAGELGQWRADGAVVRDDEPALWALRQDYTGPDGRELTRQGFFARIRVEDYGPGRIRPHERTHPGPKEDRLRLTRATRANLSPIFVLHPGRTLVEGSGEPFADVTDEDGTRHRLWRIADADAIRRVQEALADAELLIADGHHRYETARAYADEIGGEGAHRYVFACLVALEDPGLTVFPTHRLVKETTPGQQEALADALRRDFAIEKIEREQIAPDGGGGTATFGYIDAHFRQPYRLTLSDQATADAALSDTPEPYRRLDAAILE